MSEEVQYFLRSQPVKIPQEDLQAIKNIKAKVADGKTMLTNNEIGKLLLTVIETVGKIKV